MKEIHTLGKEIMFENNCKDTYFFQIRYIMAKAITRKAAFESVSHTDTSL